MQERRGRVKAAERRREEAEHSGEALQRTSCDSITQVQTDLFIRCKITVSAHARCASCASAIRRFPACSVSF